MTEHALRVAAYIRKHGDQITVAELARGTDLSLPEVCDALDEVKAHAAENRHKQENLQQQCAG